MDLAASASDSVQSGRDMDVENETSHPNKTKKNGVHGREKGKSKMLKERSKKRKREMDLTGHPLKEKLPKIAKRSRKGKAGISYLVSDDPGPGKTNTSPSSNNETKAESFGFDYKYIVAPMVGASDLPFRLLCRKYGAQLAYTPMMSAAQFGTDEAYRKEIFQTTEHDRPLVCHFSANTPQDFAAAAKVAEPFCDAIDLNLGCPQRTAYVGHFGSYLLDDRDRELVLSIVRAGVAAVKIPIFVKIRLLDTSEKTLELCQQLVDAGASLIAIHARYRASFHRNGPGARDGPALLDQITMLRKYLPPSKVVLVTNGNTITYDDVVDNLKSTQADGIMSAEGILDNPALFLGRWGSREDSEKVVQTMTYPKNAVAWSNNVNSNSSEREKKRKKMQRKILKTENKMLGVSESKRRKLFAKKDKYQKHLDELTAFESKTFSAEAPAEDLTKVASMKLETLYEQADDKTGLAMEYLQLVRMHPIPIRTLIFHTRRILKQQLTSYQLMEECLTCTTIDEVRDILEKIRSYENNPGLFQFDREKAARDKEALERKRHEEGKRKAYEARMMRKAKREGKDPEFYLRQGAVVPTQATVAELRPLDKETKLNAWRERDHSQHCLAYHMGSCARGRACAFLHVDPTTATTFSEQDEIAG